MCLLNGIRPPYPLGDYKLWQEERGPALWFDEDINMVLKRLWQKFWCSYTFYS